MQLTTETKPTSLDLNGYEGFSPIFRRSGWICQRNLEVDV
jgi:hypothetical protein